MGKKYSAVKAIKASTLQNSDYEKYYPQFVDSKIPLSDLMEDDLNNWVEADNNHPIFSEIQDVNRVDYFDLQYGSDSMQKLDVHHMKGDGLRPVIFYIHGGGWTFGDKTDSRYGGPTWVSLGYTLVSINYRFAPQNPHPAQIEDCALALKWVIGNISNYGGDPNNIAIVGHSAGAHLTALLVTGTKWHQKFSIDISKVKCWIPDSGVHDFNLVENLYHSWMPGFINALLVTTDMKEDASPINHVTGSEPPCLLIHGGDDWLVPRTNSIELYNKLTQKFVSTELEIINNYWHCSTIVNYSYSGDKPTQIINKFLAKHLPTKN